MKFRKRYAIPVVGLALSGCLGSGGDDGTAGGSSGDETLVTSMGEGEPVIGDWNIKKARGAEMPDTYTLYWDEPDLEDSGTCVREYSASVLSVRESLEAQFTMDIEENCVSAYTDWESSDSRSITYTGTVSIVETKVAYQIELTGEEALSLDCSMEDEAVLNCTDQNDKDWILEKASY